VLSEFVGKRLEEVFPVGPGDHGIVDLKQQLGVSRNSSASRTSSQCSRDQFEVFCPKASENSASRRILAQSLADNLASFFIKLF
jgi:hypothetical protein